MKPAELQGQRSWQLGSPGGCEIKDMYTIVYLQLYVHGLYGFILCLSVCACVFLSHCSWLFVHVHNSIFFSCSFHYNHHFFTDSYASVLYSMYVHVPLLNQPLHEAALPVS